MNHHQASSINGYNATAMASTDWDSVKLETWTHPICFRGLGCIILRRAWADAASALQHVGLEAQEISVALSWRLFEPQNDFYQVPSCKFWKLDRSLNEAQGGIWGISAMPASLKREADSPECCTDFLDMLIPRTVTWWFFRWFLYSHHSVC